jgi:hypothetical protein
MESKNLEIVRAAYEAYARGDLPTMRAAPCSPEALMCPHVGGAGLLESHATTGVGPSRGLS